MSPIVPGVPAAAGHQPGTPSIGTATTGNSQATVAFTAPSYLGKPVGSSYIAISTPGSITGTSSSSPITVAGLSNGTSYTFKVKLSNIVTDSLLSESSNSVIPVVPPPFFPPFFPFFPFFPYFPYFPPYFPSFKPPHITLCIGANTEILTMSGSTLAKDIVVGDKILSIGRESLDTNENAEYSLKSKENVSIVEVDVVSVTLSEKELIYFNSNEAARYSIQQPMFIFRDEELKIVISQDIIVGDILLEVDANNNLINLVPVTKISITEEKEDVIDIRTSPSKIFIAGSNIVIS